MARWDREGVTPEVPFPSIPPRNDMGPLLTLLAFMYGPPPMSTRHCITP